MTTCASCGRRYRAADFAHSRARTCSECLEAGRRLLAGVGLAVLLVALALLAGWLVLR